MRIIALVLITMVFAPVARAQESGSGKLYLGGAFGYARADEACAGIAGCEERDYSFGALGGYQLHPNFAAEAGYHNLGAATAPGGTYVRSNVWELLVVAAWRPRDPFSLYAKLGPYRGAQEGGGALAAQKERVTSLTYGVGVQFDVTDNIGLRGEWQDYPGMGGGPVLPKGDIGVFRVAALWRFR